MKKIFFFAAISALLVSCGGKNNADVIEEYPEGNNSGVVVFTEKPAVPLSQESDLLLGSLDLMGNSTYLGKGTESFKSAAVRVVVGRYNTSSDGTYNFTTGPLAGGKLVKKGNSFKFTFGSKEITGSGSFTPSSTPSDPIVKALCGAHWKLSFIEAKLKDKNASVTFSDNGHSIDPNNVEKVSEYINEKAGKELIPMSKVAGYEIAAISLSANPYKICVEFKNGKDPFEGTWTPVTSKTFTYSLNDVVLDGELFSAEASGSFDFEDNNNTLVIKMAAKSTSGLADIIIKAKKIK